MFPFVDNNGGKMVFGRWPGRQWPRVAAACFPAADPGLQNTFSTWFFVLYPLRWSILSFIEVWGVNFKILVYGPSFAMPKNSWSLGRFSLSSWGLHSWIGGKKCVYLMRAFEILNSFVLFWMNDVVWREISGDPRRRKSAAGVGWQFPIYWMVVGRAREHIWGISFQLIYFLIFWTFQENIISLRLIRIYRLRMSYIYRLVTLWSNNCWAHTPIVSLMIVVFTHTMYVYIKFNPPL